MKYFLLRTFLFLFEVMCIGLYATSTQAQTLNQPALFSQNREGDAASFYLYPKIAVASIPATTQAFVLWTEKRFGTDPFTIDLLGKQLTEPLGTTDLLFGQLHNQLRQENADLLIESAEKIHILYRTERAGQNVLIHQITNLSLTSIAERILDQSEIYLGQPVAVLLSGGQLAVCYRKGLDLMFWQSSMEQPILLASDIRPTFFEIAAIGSRSWIAVATTKLADLRTGLSSQIELFEVEQGLILGKTLAVDSPGTVGGLDIAALEPGYLALAWADDRFSTDETPQMQIFSRRRNPDRTWSAEQQETFTENDSLWPSLAWESASKLHLVWQEHEQEISEIYHQKVGQPESLQIVSKDDGFSSMTPKATMLGSKLAILWRDTQMGRADLYAAFLQN